MRQFQYELVKDPYYFSDNRVEAHSDHRFYPSVKSMQQNTDLFWCSLNGIWKFHYAKNYASTIPGFEKEEYCCKSWDDIHVPAHIQMEGYDVPQYSNVQYPWEGHEEVQPGEIPVSFNPTASYVKYFEIPEEMKGKRIFISFQGAESGIAVWLNGAYLGYSEDSFTPSEFELTDYLKEGENKLACQVFKWTAGSWCEDQDFFRFSGIYRDVYLYAIPQVHIKDLRIQTLLDDSYRNADLVIDLKSTEKGSVKITLSKNGNVIQKSSELLDLNSTCHMSVKEPELWSAEQPSLYDLMIEVFDDEGSLNEVIPYKVGFRRFELKENIMTINGKRIVFKGVNRHEFSAKTGRCVSREELIQDLVTMKQNNINAIRTCHYPDAIGIYELCDEYGIYMIAENNMETHGTWDYKMGDSDYTGIVPCDDKRWEPLLLDRVNSMFQRDKNHPAILIWSCGNESFGGSVIYEMSKLFHKLDSTRLVHYEGVSWDRRYNDTSDIESRMYAPVKEIQDFLSKDRAKPYILCEYTHAMGNSCGAMHKYTDLTDTEPLYQGGFIWDYIDQSIFKKDRYGKEFQAYGGDFGDRPTDYNFSGNGIVYGGDRKPSPKMQYVKFNYQNITANVTDTKVEIINKNLFVNTSQFECVVLIEKEGKQIHTAVLDTDVPPLSKKEYMLPFERETLPGEYAITVSFRLKEDTLWAKRGHEIAFGQSVYKVEGEKKKKKAAKFQVVESRHNFGVKGENFEAIFSYLNHGLASYRYAGKEMIDMIPKPNFWRAPTDNDNGNMMMMRYGQWKLASMYLSQKKIENGHFAGMQPVTHTVTDEYAEISFVYTLPTTPMTTCKLTYRVFGDGSIQTTLYYDPVKELGDMPEFGLIFKFDADYENVTWYGLGESETYVDRVRGAKLGVYKNRVMDNMAKYLVPQECGNKVGVRWASVTDRKGRGICFYGNEMEFSALPWTPHEIENAMHPYELPEIHYTVVKVSKQQMGVAGDDSWGACTHPEYLINTDEPLEFTFTFKGI